MKTTKITFETFDEYDEKTDKPITSFKGKWSFLSNFSPAKVQLDDLEYPTVEHAYQAAKTNVKELRIKIQKAKTPGQAKRIGKTVPLREDWNQIRLQVMEKLLRQKFRESCTDYLKLVRTYDRELIEGNTWGDTFWGVCKGKGKNNLGKLLQKIRNESMRWGKLK